MIWHIFHLPHHSHTHTAIIPLCTPVSCIVLLVGFSTALCCCRRVRSSFIYFVCVLCEHERRFLVCENECRFLWRCGKNSLPGATVIQYTSNVVLVAFQKASISSTADYRVQVLQYHFVEKTFPPIWTRTAPSIARPPHAADNGKTYL